jgi:hypothetical protein
MSPAVLPPGRGGHAMAYHVTEDVMVMFRGSTGYQANGEKSVADTWIYDLNTNTWTNMSPATNPSPRLHASLGYDNESNMIVLFGGLTADLEVSHETWEYNLTSNTWTNTTTTTYPPSRFFGVFVYDYARGRLLFGTGTSWTQMFNDIWLYDTATHVWTEILPVNDGPAFACALVYDMQSDVIIANGGPTTPAEEVFVKQTWSFNLTSNAWSNTYPPTSADARTRHSLAYDIESNTTVLYGGLHRDGAALVPLGDTWLNNYAVFEPPPAPENLDVSQGTNSLVLTWDPPSDTGGFEIAGYHVYRGTEVGVYTPLAELGEVLGFTDLTVGFGITYYYVITTVTSSGESDYSDPDEGSVALSPYDDGIYRFIVYGDTRSSDETAVAAVHDDIVSRYLQLSDPEMIIHSGDMVNHGGGNIPVAVVQRLNTGHLAVGP